MTDTRFTTSAADLDELLDIVDVDALDELETLLMVLFARPVRLDEAWDDDQDLPALEVLVPDDGVTVGGLHAFPVRLLDLVRSTAGTVDDMGTYPGSEPEILAAEIVGLDDEALIGLLQRSLGQVRVITMLTAEH